MNRFAPLLRRVNDKLNLPQPTKSRILLEMAEDLNELYNFYRNRGLGEYEAMQQAEEKLGASDEALVQLVQIHASGFRKLMDTLSQQAQTRWERIVLIVAVLFVTYFTGKEIFASRFFTNASYFIWPVLGIAFLIMILSITKSYKLFIIKDHEIKKLHAYMPTILFLGAFSLLIGVTGLIIELYNTSYKIVSEFDKAFFYTIAWLQKSSSLMTFSLFVSIFAALLWFVFLNKITKIQEAEVAFLLEE